MKTLNAQIHEQQIANRFLALLLAYVGAVTGAVALAAIVIAL